MARILDIYCRDCGAKSRIAKTERTHSDLSKLYCSCQNIDCGHQFVMTLEYSHSTRASKFGEDQLLKLMLKLLPADKKEKLISYLRQTA